MINTVEKARNGKERKGTGVKEGCNLTWSGLKGLKEEIFKQRLEGSGRQVTKPVSAT